MVTQMLVQMQILILVSRCRAISLTTAMACIGTAALPVAAVITAAAGATADVGVCVGGK